MSPFYKFGYFGDEASFIIAFITGIGFGFFLEKGGFGSGNKLAAQFYFKDLTVFKVMFTAIITAMLGIFFLGAFGLMDISMVYTTDTFMIPQIVGGLLLGLGFVVGGYCPGTSIVSCSIGRIDPIFYVIGIFVGIFIYGEVYPFISGFANSTPMGRITIPEYFNISYGIIVFLVVLMAIGGFIGSEWVEKKYGYKKGDGK